MTISNCAGQNDSGTEIESNGVAIDMRANALTLIGRDTRGHRHYHDADRERIVVTSAVHDEYTANESILVRCRLVADGNAVEHIEDDVTLADIERYVQFVHDAVDNREWVGETVQVLDGDDLFSSGREGL